MIVSWLMIDILRFSGFIFSGIDKFILHLQNHCCPVIATLASFVQTPSEEVCNSCTKEQLLKLVGY